MDYTFTLNQPLECAKEHRLPPHASFFFDYEKAFESAELNAVMRALMKEGIDENNFEIGEEAKIGCLTDIRNCPPKKEWGKAILSSLPRNGALHSQSRNGVPQIELRRWIQCQRRTRECQKLHVKSNEIRKRNVITDECRGRGGCLEYVFVTLVTIKLSVKWVLWWTSNAAMRENKIHWAQQVAGLADKKDVTHHQVVPTGKKKTIRPASKTMARTWRQWSQFKTNGSR